MIQRQRSNDIDQMEFDGLGDRMAKAHDLAVRGLFKACSNTSFDESLTLYEEYARIDINGSVSGLGAV